MSQEVKTRALVLRRYPFRERSWILHLHTETEGTVHALAHGQRSFTPLPGALLYVTLRLRPHREVQRLVEAEWDYIYQRFFQSAQHTGVLILLLEWMSQCLRAPDPSLFEWVRGQLIRLDRSDQPHLQIRPFLLELFWRLGGGPLPTSISLSEIEQAYQSFFSEWKPIRSFYLPIFADL